jgi:hypothetical protein
VARLNGKQIFIWVVGVFTVGSFVVARPVIRAMTRSRVEHDLEGRPYLKGEAVVETYNGMDRRDISRDHYMPWALVRFRGGLYKAMASIEPLKPGDRVKIFYREGRSGRIYVVVAMPPDAPDPTFPDAPP